MLYKTTAFIFFILIAFTSSIHCQVIKRVNYKKADSIAAALKYFSLNEPEKLAKELTKNETSELIKFRIIFKWIADNISYDVDLYLLDKTKELKLKYKREALKKWKKKYTKIAVSNIRKKRKSTCVGYAYLLKLMCDAISIPTEIVEGYARNSNEIDEPQKVNHAWNAVKIDGTWYFSDATWSTGYVEESPRKFKREFDEYYFLVKPEDFITDHYPKDPAWMLLVDKPTLEQFFESPGKLAGFHKNKIVHFEPSKGIQKVKKDSTIQFRFTSNSIIESIDLYEIGVNHNYSYSHSLFQEKDGYFKFEQPFRTRGTFDVYIYINKIRTLKYEIQVF